ncbi:hypothetical protein JCM10212_001742 [Sporobolomyces blumeae]
MDARDYIAPEQLIRKLEQYRDGPRGVLDLVQLVRPARLALRADPRMRIAYGSKIGFWEVLADVWKGEAARIALDDKSTIPAILALAALLISLCTQEPNNQRRAVDFVEPHLRNVLVTASSLFNLEDVEYQAMTRTCCQALANLVTGNEALASTYFPQRLAQEESDNLFQRLLASPDQGTLQALLIFLLNSVHGSKSRALLLGTSKAGSAILDRVMVLVSAVYDHDSEERPAPAPSTSDVFGLSYAIAQQMVVLEAFPQAYEAHALMPGFTISPTLVILLKFLDGHLSTSLAAPSSATLETAVTLLPFLNSQLITLSNSLLDTEATRAKDAADAATFQGVVLVLHCLCEIGLGLERAASEGIKVQRSGLADGIQMVVRLLGFAQTLTPAPAPRPAPNSSAKISEVDPSSTDPSPASSPRPRSAAADPPGPDDREPDSPAVQQLKRTCVQYLGIVSFDYRTEEGRKAQDATRTTGGLVLLLRMCQIDGRNPTLREHALLAIRNVLKGNQANQDFIESIKPQYEVAEDGSLKDLPPALRP